VKVRRFVLIVALMIGAGALVGCKKKNAFEFDSNVVPALEPADAFHPVPEIDREPGGGNDILVPPRDNFSQTTLRTGQVLIAGGTSADDARRDAFIYDQRAAEFFQTAGLVDARRGHTATLTRSGSVVVIGGVGDGWDPVSSAEIYRPYLGTWERIEAMEVPRFGHTATRLSDGNILVAGGVTSAWGFLTDTCEILDVTTLRFIDAAPIQAGPGQTYGRPRAFHTATAIPELAVPPLGDEGPCEDGNTQDVVVFIGGLAGSPGGPAAAIAASIPVFFPLESTPGPTGADRPGRWQDLVLSSNWGPASRWAHQAHRVGCDPFSATSDPTASILIVGGLSSFVPPLGALTASAPGQSALEDSRSPEHSYAKLTIDLDSLRPPGFPSGAFGTTVSVGDPLVDPFFVGGAGARSVYHEGFDDVLKEVRRTVLFAGGNSFDPLLNNRAPYSRRAYRIDPDTMTHTLAGLGDPLLAGMVEVRSFFGISFLPGPDETLGTPDDTTLVSGGEFAPTAESPNAEEYRYP
jgi:hypothetical protein